MKKCIIAEKPSLAMTIKNSINENFEKHDGYFESENYLITFAYGHLFELWSIEDYLNKEKGYWNLDDIPYVPEEFKFKLKDDDGVKKQFSVIKNLINRNDVESVINCGDSDREGQVIGDIIINKALEKNKAVYRLWLPEQTEETIRNSLRNLPLNSQYVNLYNEGLLRTIMDNLLGIQYTRYISILSKRKLPVGRVLIPIVKFIHDRDLEIKNFAPEQFYNIKGLIKDKSISFTVLKTDKNIPLKNQKEEADKIIRSLYKQAEVISIEEKDITKSPKKLFSLDTLQNKLSKEYKIKPSQTLSILQNLYQQGFITYPRTNTEYLTSNEKDKIASILELLSKDHNVAINDSSKIFNSEKVESHSAITITKKFPNIENLNKDEKLVYEVIKNRFISNFLIDKTIVTETKIILAVGKDFEVELKGKFVKEVGYLKYENDIKDTLLPKLELYEKLDVEYTLEQAKTKAKPHVTTEELNNYLKNPFKKDSEDSEEEDYKAILEGLEIGTVATRGQIIDNAIEYGYVELKKDSYYITDIGLQLIKLLDKLNINLYKETTVEFSKILKKVYRNESTIENGITIISDILKKDIKKDVQVEAVKQEKEVIGKCLRCGCNVYESDKNFYCEGYKNTPKCTFVIWKEDKFFIEKGKKVTKSVASKLLKDKAVTIKGLKKKDGKGEYNAKIGLIDKEVNGTLYANFKVLEFVK